MCINISSGKVVTCVFCPVLVRLIEKLIFHSIRMYIVLNARNNGTIIINNINFTLPCREANANDHQTTDERSFGYEKRLVFIELL